jgi:hypothetical protein
MPAEPVYTHRHDAGFLRSDWDYYTDASVDDAVARLREAAADGLSADEVLEFIRSAVDLDQITFREARMLNAILKSFYPQMTDPAERVADAFMAEMRKRVVNLDDMDDEQFANYTHPWIGSALRTGAGDPVMRGDELHDFMGDLQRIGHPPPSLVSIPLTSLHYEILREVGLRMRG